MRRISSIDKLLAGLNEALMTVFASTPNRSNPAADIPDVTLNEIERRKSEGYMRVNHTGEVCAQALYRGHLSVCHSQQTRELLMRSCDEETAHLIWTQERLKELNGRTSYLNVLWYLNSYLIGVIAGLAGDRWSLGFVEETEIQVGKHLTKHLGELPQADLRSRAIVEKMREEEAHHEHAAHRGGAAVLPSPIKKLMQLQSQVMTSMAYWV